MSDNKNILIVGASSGIGAATAKALSNDQNTIILMARRKEKLLEVQKEMKGKSEIVACNVSNYEEIGQFFDSIKEKGIKLSTMIYVAGDWYIKPIKAMESGEIDRMFSVNFFGFFEMCRIFQSPKISERGASIIAVSSYSSIMKECGMSAYATSKCAMNACVQIMAKEFAKRELRVNAILPANVMSRMKSEHNIWSEEELQGIKEKQSFGIIPLDEITSLIKYLDSPDSKHMTGELLTISAGYKSQDL